jgi:hypothetical protein
VSVSIAFRAVNGGGSRICAFRGSTHGLRDPLPTLCRYPRRQLRKARGRSGSLLLHRSGLALLTPRRSPGALALHLWRTAVELNIHRLLPKSFSWKRPVDPQSAVGVKVDAEILKRSPSSTADGRKH